MGSGFQFLTRLHQQQQTAREIEYDLNKPNNQPTENYENGTRTHEAHEPDQDALAQLQCAGEGAGGAGRVDGESASGGHRPAALNRLDHAQPVGGPGDGRNAPGAEEPGEPGQWRVLESAIAGALERAAAAE